MESDHLTVHRHPRSILEVRRVLLQHLTDMRIEMAAAYGEPLYSVSDDGCILRLSHGEPSASRLPGGGIGVGTPQGQGTQ